MNEIQIVTNTAKKINRLFKNRHEGLSKMTFELLSKGWEGPTMRGGGARSRWRERHVQSLRWEKWKGPSTAGSQVGKVKSERQWGWTGGNGPDHTQ